MAAMAVEKPKVAGFVNSGYNRSNRKRIEQEEKELEDLISGKVEDEEPEVKEEEVAPKETPKEEPKVLSKEEESFKKRYGDLRRHMQQKEKEWEDRLANLESSKKSLSPPTSDEDLEAWVNKHPDVAAIVKALAAKEADKRVRDTEQTLTEINNDRYELNRKKAEQQIREHHPDFDEIKESDDFHTWAEDQPKWVQDAVYENQDDPRSVVRVIDLYKVDKGLTKKDKKQKEKEAASLISTRSKPALDEDETAGYYSESQVNKMSNQEYEKHEEKILEAMRVGKFKYDLSGGAR